MSRGTHAQRILELVARAPGLNDDEIAQVLSITPRQTVNQICRRLAESGVLTRTRGDGGKIVNSVSACGPPAKRRATVRRYQAAASRRTNGALPSGKSLVPADLARTLLIVPCSKKKRDKALAGKGGDTILRHLPPALAQELSDARHRVKERTPVDETALIPAWRRYDGSLYDAGRDALCSLARSGCHIVILSGGYGAVLADEPIGMYNTILKPSWWPERILERVLIVYAKRHGLSSIRAFAAATGAYRQVLRRVPWRNEGIDDALLLTPQARSGGTRKSPASIGEALCALCDGNLAAGWRSSYGLGLDVQMA